MAGSKAVAPKDPSPVVVRPILSVETWHGESVELHPNDVWQRFSGRERRTELSTAEVLDVAGHRTVVDHYLQAAGTRLRRVDYAHHNLTCKGVARSKNVG